MYVRFSNWILFRPITCIYNFTENIRQEPYTVFWMSMFKTKKFSLFSFVLERRPELTGGDKKIIMSYASNQLRKKIN